MPSLRPILARLALAALVLLPLIGHAATGDNQANASVNLALLSSASVTGSAASGAGRGMPSDILFDPATGTYAARTGWNEYGVAYGANLGRVGEAAAFTWQVSWSSAKNINYVTIGGSYANQPQTNTMWNVQRRLGSTWTTIAEGKGGWISNGIFTWGGAEQPAVVADGLRLLAYSDGANDLFSIHLRGRGGQSNGEDERGQPIKATLVQYLSTTTTPPPVPPTHGVVNVLFDTDIGPDCDDAGTVAILHAMADAGECRILGMAATVSSEWAAPCLDALNTYYGRPDILIGTLKDSGFLNASSYSENVAKNFPNDLRNGANAPDAVTMYRRVLAAQPDGSVVMVAVGPLRNMSYLVRSGADGVSGLTGRDLIARKVKSLVIMGGRFPSGQEWNIEQDPLAAQIVAREWPTDMVFSDEPIGASIITGHSLTSKTPVTNPVRRAYELWVGPNRGRSSWDQTAAYYAIRGGDGLFGLSGPGTADFQSNGSASFTPSTNGRHRYMTKLVSNSQIAAVIEELMVRAPGATPPPTAPAITTQPGNATVTAPATATFSVAASGSPAPTYQWSSAPSGSTTFTAISGATSASYTTGATSTGMNGTQYRCVATNSAGSTTSTAATLTVTAAATAPVITSQPSNTTVTAPATATFSVAASGSPAPTYQWSSAPSGSTTFTAISGATSASYTTGATSTAMSGTQYRCVATNSAGSTTSTAATLTVTAAATAPAITSQPTNATVTAPATATFSVAASGSPAPTFQWESAPSGSATFSPISGATSASYTTGATSTGMNGTQYRSVATNSAGSTTSTAATLTVTAAATAPAITSQPTNVTVTAPATATYTVTASGSPVPTFQWESAPSGSATFTAISGATSASYTTGATSTGMNGTQYRCVATNSAGSTTSTAATLTVTAAATAPAITTQPTNVTVTAPATATYTVTASGSPAPTFQWESAPSGSATFTAISGATSASYTTGATSTGMNGTQYRCVATNSAGAATSNVATLTVNAVALRNPENPAGTVAGLAYAYYAVATDGTIPNLAALVPTATGTVTTFDLSSRTRDDNIAFVYTGYLSVPTDGVYTLYTTSDDGSRLLIGTTVVVDNDGPHAMQERSGVIGLKAGRHALTVHFAQGAGGFGLEVRWEGPGIAKALVPANALFRIGTATATVPTISSQPVSLSVVVGATATFSVTASGTPAPTYQWQKNGTNIGSANAPSYTTPATVTGDNGATYRCVVTNSAGSVTSTSATLTVTVTPVVVVVPPTPAAPTVSGEGTATPTLSGTSVAGATITIYDGATLLGTVTANSSGAWTFAPTLTAGMYQITTTASNSAGTSAASPAVTVVIPSTSGGSGGSSGDSGGSCGFGGLGIVMLALGALVCLRVTRGRCSF